MEPIIEVKHLKKHYKDIKAVDDISFTVLQGELYGFLGVNGAGKSTTINILCTLLNPTEGKVNICGLTLGKEDEEIRKKIGVVFQSNSLDTKITIKENLLIRGSLYHKDNKVLKKHLDSVCEILHIEELLNRQFGKLSGGQKRRCEIARALMNTPEILFLDEPTTGLDPQTRLSVWECIEALRREKKMTVFLTTHYMEEAAKANHIAIMEAGHIAATGTPYELKAQFTKDIVKLYSEDPKVLVSSLADKNCTFKVKSNHVEVEVDNTLSSLELLNDLKDELNACEIMQGTMDDVFLNITGRTLQ